MPISLNLHNDRGLSSSDGLTNDNAITITGLESGAVWYYQIDGTGAWLMGGVANVSGIATFSGALNGTHTYSISQTNVAGNSEYSPKLILNYDATAPLETSKTTLIPTGAKNRIELAFNEAVYRDSGNIIISKSGQAVHTINILDTLQVSLSSDSKALILTPAFNMTAGTYSLTMNTGVIKDLAGNDFSGYSGNAWQVVVSALTTSSAWMNEGNYVGEDGYINNDELTSGLLQLTGLADISGYTNVSISKIILNAETGTDITLTNNLPTISANGNWTLANNAFANQIQDNTKYTAEVYLTSSSGDNVTSVGTAITVDKTLPTAVVPTNEINLKDTLQITFSEAMKAISGNIVIMKKGATDTIFATIAITDTAQLTWSSDNKTLNIKPSLNAGTNWQSGEYYLQINSGVLTDLAGNSYTETRRATQVYAVRSILLRKIASGTGGFVINGENEDDYSGWSISSAGDVNGDGLADLIVGAYQADPAGRTEAGKSYVVFGKTGTASVELSSISNGTGGFAINGEQGRHDLHGVDHSGYSVSSAGDVNGDGLADLIVGAPLADDVNPYYGGFAAYSGKSYVVFGKTDTTAVELSQIEGRTGGFVMNGVNGSNQIGYSVSSAGDVNGDGLADLIVGGIVWADISYVVFGKADTTAINLNQIADGTGGFVINGDIDEAVSSAGDVNGDGLADLIVGTYYADPAGINDAGKSYVVFGKTSTTTVELSNISNGTGGFVINGENEDDYSGRSVSSAGDVNGDGLADLIVGAPQANLAGGKSDAGKSYVVFGKISTTSVELSQIASGTGGFVINGENFNDRSGCSVSSAGDVNGDGFADLIVGASWADPAGSENAGKSYVVFGKTSTTTVELSNISNGTGGFSINGESAHDNSGISVSSAGDVNGDGLADLIVGAYYADPAGRTSAGKSYVIFGSTSNEFYQSKVDWMGTSDDENHASTSTSTTAQTLVGADGNDTLTAGSGADVLYGGRGDDIFVINSQYLAKINTGFDVVAEKLAAINGGLGIDTLCLGQNSGITNLDLTTIKNIASRITSIEKIDLSTDTLSNTLKLSYQIIKDMAGINWINSNAEGTDGKTKTGNLAGWTSGTYTLKAKEEFYQLVVNGGANDQFDIDFSTTSLGTVTNGGITYNVYQDTAHKVQLFVQSEVSIFGVSPLTTSVTWMNEANDVGRDGYINQVEFNANLIITGTTSGTNYNSAAISKIILNAETGTDITLTNNLPTISANGNWTFANNAFANAIQDNTKYTVEVYLSSGHDIATAISTAVVIDKTPPAMPTLALKTDTGVSASDKITRDDTLTVTGLESGAVWFYQVDGTAGAWITGSGAEFNPSVPDGLHTYYVKQVDTAGNSSIASITAGLDAVAPTAPTLALKTDTGVSASDKITRDDTLTVTGLESGAVWFYQVDSTDGAWITGSGAEFNPSVPDGLHTYYVKQVDTAGNSSIASITAGLDAVAPTAVIPFNKINLTGTLHLQFNEVMKVGSGNIIVMKKGITIDTTFATIVSSDTTQLSWSADSQTLNIKPNQNWQSGEYYLTINSGILTDLAGNSYTQTTTTRQFYATSELAKPAIQLSNIAQRTGGFVINGENTGDFSGYSVSSAGDVNGDGFGDLIVGAYRADPAGRTDAGKSYVVFGKTDTTAINLSQITRGTGGFAINGENTGDQSGISVSSAGDINGDGLTDLIVGATYAQVAKIMQAGKSYVVFGKTSTTLVELSNIAKGMGGFTINGENTYDRSGDSVSSAGDVNGDGLNDFIVGASFADPDGRTNAGKSYVVFGKTDTTAINLSQITRGTGGFAIDGERGSDWSGESVASAGDVNGDGLSDLIVGAYLADPAWLTPSWKMNAGKSYVVFGKTDTTSVSLSKIAGGTGGGFAIDGEGEYDQSGISVSSAGDVNGDGLADLIIGASLADPAGRANAGKSYVVFGKTDTTAINLSQITRGTGGFSIEGENASDASGISVSSAGDVNGDGLADLIIGASLADPAGRANAGKSYVVFGKTDTTAINLSQITRGTGGFSIEGENASDAGGISVSSAGDVNGDGLADLIIGASLADPAGKRDAGKVYVIFGSASGEFYQTKVDWMGTSADESRSSTSTAGNGQTLVGGDGSDTLTAGQGADVLYGGRGDDIFIINSNYLAKLGTGFDAGAQRLATIDGGLGIDTLRLNANSGNLDLTAIKNIASGNPEINSRIASIEKIDLAVDASANTLKLSFADIQDMAGMNWINSSTTGTDGKTKTGNLAGWVGGTYTLKEKEEFHQLVMNGGTTGTAKDIVDIDFAFTGTNAPVSSGTVTQTIAGTTTTYNVYQDTAHKVEIFIQSGMTVL